MPLVYHGANGRATHLGATKKKAATRLEGYGSPRAAGRKGEQTPGAIKVTISHIAQLAFNRVTERTNGTPTLRLVAQHASKLPLIATTETVAVRHPTEG